jgi:Tfp pilus assembly ATPase PilU
MEENLQPEIKNFIITQFIQNRYRAREFNSRHYSECMIRTILALQLYENLPLSFLGHSSCSAERGMINLEVGLLGQGRRQKMTAC